jgi:hypothetical protein
MRGLEARLPILGGQDTSDLHLHRVLLLRESPNSQVGEYQHIYINPTMLAELR